MADFVICTDSACDLDTKVLDSLGVRYAELTFRFDGEDGEYTNYGMESKVFYDKMREGGIAKTAAINSESFIALFSEVLDTGADVLYLGFSSGLSTTFNSGRIAAGELAEKYPDRKIEVIDTLAASAGEGLLVYLAAEKKKSGASLDEVAAFIRETAPKLCHWFTVDDLVYLKRGGRVSPTVAFVGNLLGIKPVLHVDDDGHLINVSKARGRKNAIMALADKYAELAEDKAGGTVFISQADCKDDAEFLAKVLNEKHGVKVESISNIGPVIGAHSGPGTLALFFVGSKR
ncbi:MAG: DegV family protein [Clostridia bacterium]|nr:DegV family protein [Clostridia bacterium]